MSSNFNVQRNKFPVTLEGFSLHDYTQFETDDGIAYKVTLHYRGNAVCSLYNSGTGGETELYIHDSLKIQALVTEAEKLLRKINEIACSSLQQPMTVLHEFYTTAYREQASRAAYIFEGLFSVLYEFNEAYFARTNSKKDTYVFSIVGNGSLLAAYLTATPCCTYGACADLQAVIQFTLRGGRLCNYAFYVKANTRVLHLTVDDVYNAFKVVRKAYEQSKCK